MKKIYSLTLISVFALFSSNTNAANIPIQILANNTFSPSYISNVVVGDVIVWTLMGGTHTTTSVTIPATALPWNSGNMTTSSNTTFSYTVSVVGNYLYGCTIHGVSNMGGGFTAIPVGINEPNINLITNAYPNPFNDKITLKYVDIESIEVFNIVGSKVKAMELAAGENKTEIDFSGMPAGVYFYRTYKEGTLIETRKIIKAD